MSKKDYFLSFEFYARILISANKLLGIKIEMLIRMVLIIVILFLLRVLKNNFKVAFQIENDNSNPEVLCQGHK